MNTRHSFRWFWPALVVLCLAVPFITNHAAANRITTPPQGAAAKPSIENAGGLTVIRFTVSTGTIKVSLPDDIRAGDTISGTVFAEPKGESKEERAANGEKLKGQVVVIRDQKVPVQSVTSYLSFLIALPGMTPSGAVITPDPKITVPTHPSGAVITPDPKITTPPGRTQSGAVITPDPKITPSPENLDPMAYPPSFFDVFLELDPSSAGRARIPVKPGMTPTGAVITPDPKITTPPGMTPSGAIITPDPKITQPTHPSGAIITPDPKITSPTPPPGQIITIPGSTFGTTPMDRDIVPGFDIPRLGQTGRPIVITGPFDGDSSTTALNFFQEHFQAPQIQQLDTVTEKELARNSFRAESPRKAVFEAPTNVTGPIEIKLKEGGVETKGAFRNLKIDLTAPKTSLLKGESTELHMAVQGLEGIKQPVPLTIESHGVITMVGGNYQRLEIQPSEVGADGRYTTTRGITGVQTGGWTAIATVVTHKFDVCLQDDTAPARRILWNTFNGDYIFVCPGCWPPKTGGTTESGGTIAPADPNFPPTDPPGGLTGKGKMIMKGCIITLNHNAPDRRVFATLDTCTTSGTSTVEDAKAKTKFTITDRNIADNTCPN